MAPLISSRRAYFCPREWSSFDDQQGLIYFLFLLLASFTWPTDVLVLALTLFIKSPTLSLNDFSLDVWRRSQYPMTVEFMYHQLCYWSRKASSSPKKFWLSNSSGRVIELSSGGVKGAVWRQMLWTMAFDWRFKISTTEEHLPFHVSHFIFHSSFHPSRPWKLFDSFSTSSESDLLF